MEPLMLVVLHSSIPFLVTGRSESGRLTAWKKAAPHAGLRLVQYTPQQSLEGAVLVVGRDHVPDDALASRLRAAHDSVSVVLDTWLDACSRARARVPLSKHRVAPTWLPPAPPASLGCAAADALSSPGPPTPVQQQQHPVTVVTSLAIVGPCKRNLGVFIGGQPAQLPQGAIDAALAVVAAAAGASGSSCGSARAGLQAADEGVAQTGSSQEPALSSALAAKRQRTGGHGSSSTGGSELEPAAGTHRLDLAAAGVAALAAARQLSIIAQLSDSTVAALREIVVRRTWVPANASPAAPPAAAVGCAAAAGSSSAAAASGVAQPLPSGADHMRVVSYNLLADACATSGSCKTYCRREFRAWSSRWPRLAGELRAYAPDILCLQEADELWWPLQQQPLFQQHLGLQGLWLPRGECFLNGRKLVLREGVALLWRTSRFALVRSRAVKFRELLPTPIPPGEGEFWRLVGAYQEGVVMALLQDRTTGRLLLAASTHFWFEPRLPHVKVAQAHLLCGACRGFVAELLQAGLLAGLCTSSSAEPAVAGGGSPLAAAPTEQQVSDVLERLPVIIGGDFNSVPAISQPDPFNRWVVAGVPQSSGVYELLSSGRLLSTHNDHPARRGFGAFRCSRSLPICAGPGSSSSGGSSDDGSASDNDDTAGTEAALAAEIEATAATAAAKATEWAPTQRTQFHAHGLQLQSAYRAARGVDPPLTLKTPSYTGCLDYIWTTCGSSSGSGRSSGGSIEVVGVLSMPYEWRQQQQGVSSAAAQRALEVMPNALWPSDHLALGAVLRLR